MASSRDGAIESAHRRDVRHAFLRRQGQSGDRQIDEYHSRHRGGDAFPHARPAAKGISGLPGRRGMNLDDAVQQIHDELIDDAVIEAAAARVWANLSGVTQASWPAFRTCADFQAVIPDFKA